MIQFSRRGDGKFQLEMIQLLPAGRAKVFDFFSDAFQLTAITPPWLGFSIVTPAPIDMRVGALIDYKARLYGFQVAGQSKIVEWDPEEWFVDEQVQGPYRYWRHEHTFEIEGECTIVRDRIIYAVPLGVITHRLFVQRTLEKIFEYRRERLYEFFA
jgi:ligand-binding SRPBCC domain-containing protein